MRGKHDGGYILWPIILAGNLRTSASMYTVVYSLEVAKTDTWEIASAVILCAMCVHTYH